MTLAYLALAALWLIAGVTVTKCLCTSSARRDRHPHDEGDDWLMGTIWGLAFAVAFSAWLVMR